jgi:DNA-binding transcriptional ArsR family regulator
MRRGKGRVRGEGYEPELEEKARMFAALGHPLRLVIVSTLASNSGPLSPVAIERLMGNDTPGLPNLSYHTRQLRAAGLIRQRKTAARRGAIEHYFSLTDQGERAAKLIDSV